MFETKRFVRRFLPVLFDCLLLFHLAQQIPSASAEEGHCIWYGVCAEDKIEKQRNCFYDGTAKPIQEGTRPVLEKYCPDIAAGGVSCCDDEQLRNFDHSIKLAENILNYCPTCMENFVKHICGMTCSPKQSEFIKPVKIAPFNATHQRIEEIDYHLSTTYKKATFESCSQIQLPKLCQLGLDLMCGEWGAANCNHERWFNFMGNGRDNPFVPFQINYIEGDAPVDGYTPYNPETRACNVGLQGQPGCSCQDCAASCANPSDRTVCVPTPDADDKDEE